MSGFLIAFEGNEGAGKSTQITHAARELEQQGRSVCVTREPGGTALGRELRRLVLHTHPAPAPVAELFLYLADRAQHLHDVIEPALKKGHVVLTDRFSGSTIAYQAAGRGLAHDAVVGADALARSGRSPHLNILLLCPVRVGLARARGDDRFHAEEEVFHERVHQGFLALAAADARHWRVIDATQTEAEVHRQVMDAIREAID